MRKHEKFILTPITSILDEGCCAMSLIDDGLETYPLSEYLMQSLILKMTGFQEQKVKCILWELATDDYELRYRRFKKEQIGEASSYDDKVKVFDDLAKAVKRLSGEEKLGLLSDNELEDIVSSTNLCMKNFSARRLVKGWLRRQYNEYMQLFGNCDKECLMSHTRKGFDFFAHCDNCGKKRKAQGKQVCGNYSLKQVYESVFKHRNRCAHNTRSHEQNLPSLDILQRKDYILENYFIRFAMLIIIDKLFVALFDKYLTVSLDKFRL